jgi:hypothetical protein
MTAYLVMWFSLLLIDRGTLLKVAGVCRATTILGLPCHPAIAHGVRFYALFHYL